MHNLTGHHSKDAKKTVKERVQEPFVQVTDRGSSRTTMGILFEIVQCSQHVPAAIIEILILKLNMHLMLVSKLGHDLGHKKDLSPFPRGFIIDNTQG